MGPCTDNCTVSIELGIPCHHTIYEKLLSATHLRKWDVHPRWHLRAPVSQDVYRRILDPKIASNLRGRPRNNPQPLPASMGIRARSQPRRERLASTGLARQTAALRLGLGNTTWLRASGRRVQPSVRRQMSQWELAIDDQTPASTHSGAAAISTRKQVRRCTKCHAIGHYKTSKSCPLRCSVPHQVIPQPVVSSPLPLHVIPDDDQALQSGEVSTVSQPFTEGPSRRVLAPTTPHAPRSSECSDTSDGSPQAIYQRYVTARAAWYAGQPRGNIKTNQEYRRAVGLPLRYDRQWYAWCVEEIRMTPLCKTPAGAREWTKEEMMAYLDWIKAGNDLPPEQAQADAEVEQSTCRFEEKGRRKQREKFGGDPEEYAA